MDKIKEISRFLNRSRPPEGDSKWYINDFLINSKRQGCNRVLQEDREGFISEEEDSSRRSLCAILTLSSLPKFYGVILFWMIFGLKSIHIPKQFRFHFRKLKSLRFWLIYAWKSVDCNAPLALSSFTIKLRSHSDGVNPSIWDSWITASFIAEVTLVQRSSPFVSPSIFGNTIPISYDVLHS